ncbi:MAG: hypothetical protein J6T26_04355 [Firmicutes bacterium]|nr:hypothetical protein [Bacillota bacterium]
MNTYRFIKYFGLAFLLLGVILAAVNLFPGVRLMGGGGVLLMVGAIFALVGGIFFVLGSRLDGNSRRVLKEGEPHRGKIFDYDYDPSVTMNGSPLLLLIVRYFDDAGEVKEAVIPTGSPDRGRYPRGATVAFRLLEGKAALEGKPTDEALPGEERLLQSGFDPSGTAPRLGVHCPNCSAPVNVPLGMAEVCPYCGTVLRLDEQGRLL